MTAANVYDVAVLPDLLHGEETRVWGEGAYQGQSGGIARTVIKIKTEKSSAHRPGARREAQSQKSPSELSHTLTQKFVTRRSA